MAYQRRVLNKDGIHVVFARLHRLQENHAHCPAESHERPASSLHERFFCLLLFIFSFYRTTASQLKPQGPVQLHVTPDMPADNMCIDCPLQLIVQLSGDRIPIGLHIDNEDSGDACLGIEPLEFVSLDAIKTLS